MNTPTPEQKEKFQLHQSLIGYHVTLNGYKSNDVIEIMNVFSSLLISIENMENKLLKHGSKHIGTDEWHSTRTVIDSFKMEIIKKITEL